MSEEAKLALIMPSEANLSEAKVCQVESGKLQVESFQGSFLFYLLPFHFTLSSFIFYLPSHSYRNASTGLRLAARQLCQLTVSNATIRAVTPARAKIHQLRAVL